MTKIYLKDLKVEEIIARLDNGEKVYAKDCDSDYYYKMIDGVICEYDGKSVDIGCSIINATNSEILYFETEEPFKITHTGLYKTRDGRKASVADVGKRFVYGCIAGSPQLMYWDIDSGQCQNWIKDISGSDIVSEWGE